MECRLSSFHNQKTKTGTGGIINVSKTEPWYSKMRSQATRKLTIMGNDRNMNNQRNRFSPGTRDDDFDQIYHANIGRIYNMVFHMVGNAEDTEEIVQEIFSRAHKTLHSFEGRSSVATWLGGIAMNVISNFFRKKKRAPQTTTNYNFDEIEAEPDLDHGGKVENIFFKKEKLKEIRNALLKLPLEYRSVFFLVAVEGNTHPEAGRVLGISEGTSRVRMFRAVKMLRTDLLSSDSKERE